LLALFVSKTTGSKRPRFPLQFASCGSRMRRSLTT
jgi:hypothetical protein